MPLETALFDYSLPKQFIAQEPAAPRDHSRLMLLNRRTGAITHRHFFEIADALYEGDVLVLNNTKVWKSRLYGRVIGQSDFSLELFLLHEKEGLWEVLLKPGCRIPIGSTIDCHGLRCRVISKKADGIALVQFHQPPEKVIAFADVNGEIPLPPYIKQQPGHGEYQTVYAKVTGSVAAPTAGFHFTEELIEQLKGSGVEFEFITLHVGLGTFRPIQTQTLDAHRMHHEQVLISPSTAARIHKAKKEGRRVIAIGTTTVRALEGAAAYNGQLAAHGFTGEIGLFIQPGFSFCVIDGLMTNFHLPKSTLLVLVSAFAGVSNIQKAYQEAMTKQYRFFSFGDAMFVL